MTLDKFVAAVNRGETRIRQISALVARALEHVVTTLMPARWSTFSFPTASGMGMVSSVSRSRASPRR